MYSHRFNLELAKGRRRRRGALTLVTALVFGLVGLVMTPAAPAFATTTWSCNLALDSGAKEMGRMLKIASGEGTTTLYQLGRVGNSSTGALQWQTVTSYSIGSDYTMNGLFMTTDGRLYAVRQITSTGSNRSLIQLKTDGTYTTVSSMASGSNPINSSGVDFYGTGNAYLTYNQKGQEFIFNASSSTISSGGFTTVNNGTVKDVSHIPQNASSYSSGYRLIGVDENSSAAVEYTLSGYSRTRSLSYSGFSLDTSVGFGSAATLGNDMVVVRNDGVVAQLAPNGSGWRVTNLNVTNPIVNSKTDGTSCSTVGLTPVTVSQTVTLAYDANGGTGDPADQTCTEGVNTTLSTTVPTRDGYTFAGWNTVQGGTGTTYQPGSTFVCASATLYAQWVQDVSTSTITYDAQGGSGDPADSTCTTGVQIQLGSEVPSKTGYTFIGWNTQADGNGTAYAPSSTFTCADLNLYAIWTANTSVVEFDPQGGAGEPADNTCVDGSTVVIPTTQPTRTGYTFAGWNSAPDGTGTTYLASQAIVCSDLTIYAQWTQDTVTYTVAYEPNGGTGDPADQTCTSGNLTLSTTAPTQSGYTFTGWNTEAGGTGTAYAGGSTVTCQNLTLHAQWSQAGSVTVAYEPNGGSGDPADQPCT
ncbi:MAG: hypothetical protein EBY47_07730, partial [Actinobacteria bacterium]|nr:hypothetical protein [Actinomycetota bacterium]